MHHRRLMQSAKRTPALALLAAMALLLAAIAPVAAQSVRTNPEPDLVCPEGHGTGAITDYTTTVETPADSADWYVSVEFTVADHGGAAASCELSLATYELPSSSFSLPQALFASDTGTFAAGTHTLTAELPREAEVDSCFSQYDFVFGPVLDEITSPGAYDHQIRARIVGSETCGMGGEQPAETGTVLIMKHVCPDEIQSVEQFDALGGFLDKVLACPVITLPGDDGPAGALDADDDFFDQFVAGGTTGFNFTVGATNGSWDLGASTFMPAQLCETDLGADANGDGTISPDVCVEVSHYGIDGVAEGAVSVTESTPPTGFRFGDIEFTPMSGDDATLVSIDNAAGVVQLDTTSDDGTTGTGAAGPDAVMVHVYNFANVEAEQPGQGQAPDREGTQGSQGGPGQGSLPDTALPVNERSPLELLAVLTFAGAIGTSALRPAMARRHR